MPVMLLYFILQTFQKSFSFSLLCYMMSVWVVFAIMVHHEYLNNALDGIFYVKSNTLHIALIKQNTHLQNLNYNAGL